ncbi:MAG: cellulose binding domain-containing protein, partial [Cyanobacteria bacterium P01_G01_bin.19]
MLVNKNTFNIKSKITDDWGNGHRLEIDIEALRLAPGWELEIDVPEDYNVRGIYGAELIDKSGKTYISGMSWNQTLSKGDNIEVVLVIDEGDSSHLDPIEPKFVYGNSKPTKTKPTKTTKNKLSATSSITEDWNGGYKLELDINAQASAKNWSLDFELPYEISAAYGVDLINNGNCSYTIKGQNNQATLNKGQTISSVFIVQDGGGEATTPNFGSSNLVFEPKPKPVIVKE